MKTLHLSIIVVAGFALFIGSAIFLILPLQSQPGGYMLVQTDTISKNVTSIHTCISKQEQVFDLGPPGFASLLCPISPHTYTKVIDYSGFDNVCHDKKYDAENYVLKAGHNGSITYRIYLDVPYSDIFRFLTVDMTNHASFEHYAPTVDGGGRWNYTETLDGASVFYEPRSEVLWPWSSALVTAKVLTSHDAKEGSHWLILSPGMCSGGPAFILTIDNASRMN
ncbi:MAG: hypothetical protein HY223_05935 [Thaumarchaeota archaeon]|nr:hypothetical protein [Nitrososphaerota archaeon]